MTDQSRRISELAEKFRRGWEFSGPVTNHVSVSKSEVTVTFTATGASRASQSIAFSVAEIETILDLGLLYEQAKKIAESVMVMSRGDAARKEPG